MLQPAPPASSHRFPWQAPHRSHHVLTLCELAKLPAPRRCRLQKQAGSRHAALTEQEPHPLFQQGLRLGRLRDGWQLRPPCPNRHQVECAIGPKSTALAGMWFSPMILKIICTGTDSPTAEAELLPAALANNTTPSTPRNVGTGRLDPIRKALRAGNFSGFGLWGAVCRVRRGRARGCQARFDRSTGLTSSSIPIFGRSHPMVVDAPCCKAAGFRPLSSFPRAVAS